MTNVPSNPSTGRSASTSAINPVQRISTSPNDMEESDTASQPRGVKRPARSQKRGTSCAECRRLKLKCDRGTLDSWPCVQCRRRKCSELCPGSTSTPTVKAGNEKLLRLYRSKIADLESRLSAASSAQNPFRARLERTNTASSSSPLDQSVSSFAHPFSPALEIESQYARGHLSQDVSSMPLPAGTSPHRRASCSSASPPSSIARNDQPQSVAPQNHDDVSDQSGEQIDQLYWPEDAAAPAASPAHAANTVPPVTESGPTVAAPATSDNDVAGRSSVPSGPTFFGRSAGALYRQPEKGNLFDTSPMISSPHLQQNALSVLPPTLWQAQELLDRYDARVAWMYTPVDVTFLQRTIQQLYSGSAGVLTEPRLAMVLLALALGALFDGDPMIQSQHHGRVSTFPSGLEPQHVYPQSTSTSHANDHPWSASIATVPAQSAGSQSERIFQLGFKTFLRQSSALSVFAPCVWESAACAHLAVSYLLSRGQADNSHAAWQVLGTGIRMAVSLGLHCIQSLWNLPPEQISAHARVWWELQAYERLQSLNFGRPACLPEHVSCRPPFQLPASDWKALKPNKEVFHAIKYQLGPLYAKINLLHCQEETPTVTQVMSIDAEVRSFMRNIPSWLLLEEAGSSSSGPANSKDGASSVSSGQNQTSHADWNHILPQKHMLSLLFHKAILFLHRPCFCKATQNTNEPLLSPYASSFAAAIGSARQHTMLFKSAMETCPSALKWWFFIFHLYTAAVLQAQVLLRCPRSMLATEVQNDLEISFSLLTRAATTNNVARRAASHLGSLRSKILRRLGAESSRSARPHAPNSAAGALASSNEGNSSRPLASPAASGALSARTGLDTLSEAAASSRITSSLNSSSYTPFQMVTSSSIDSVDSTAPTMLSPVSNVSLTGARAGHQNNEPTYSDSSFFPHQQYEQHNNDQVQQQQCASALAAYHGMEDLSAILESDSLPPEIASGPPAQWAWMDPLLQATLFWHTDSNGSLDRS